jgi:class 3 adenylate cyclase
VRVRIGLHTGAPRVTGDDYVGLDVHRAARICAAAHGGQVVISEATAMRVAVEDGRGVVLRDLGEHRLKDLSRPLRLHQVAARGLGTSFPPLRVAAAVSASEASGLARSSVGRQRGRCPRARSRGRRS